MSRALLGIGGNVGDVRRTLREAVTELCARLPATLLARSRDYATPPWGDTDQPPFVNACLLIETSATPEAILDVALAVERQFGRDRARERRWGPRRLDIDLLAVEGQTRHSDTLTLPHPRMLERAFVLVPAVEIAPDWTIGGITLAAAAARIDRTGVEPLPEA